MNSLYKLASIIAILLIVGLIIISLILSNSVTNIGGFQKTVLIVAIIFLIFNLVIISLGLNYSKKKNWPPMVPNCPDYWVSDGSGENATCKNVKDLGVCKPAEGDDHLIMNFNKAPFLGGDGNCAKYTWANNCKVAWDGITYGVSNPCV